MDEVICKFYYIERDAPIVKPCIKCGRAWCAVCSTIKRTNQKRGCWVSPDVAPTKRASTKEPPDDDALRPKWLTNIGPLCAPPVWAVLNTPPSPRVVAGFSSLKKTRYICPIVPTSSCFFRLCIYIYIYMCICIYRYWNQNWMG